MTQWYGIGPGRDMHPAVSQQTPAGKIKRSKHENFIPRNTISDTYWQGSKNCGILPPGLRGRGDREGNGRKDFTEMAKNGVFY